MKGISLIVILGIASIPLRNFIENSFHTRESKGSFYMDSPPSIKMFSSIVENAEKYNIPIRYALGIAYVETRYEGPTDWNYNPALTSPAGALGPMQIMPGTAKMMWGENIHKKKLKEDIDFNVETSMKLLNKLHKKYKDWKIVFGCYNTGKPCVNEYAERVYNFKPNSI